FKALESVILKATSEMRIWPLQAGRAGMDRSSSERLAQSRDKNSMGLAQSNVRSVHRRLCPLRRHFLAFLAALGEPDGDRLFGALHRPAFAALATLERALFAPFHRALDAL